jgi:hypothetical protein
MCKPLLSMSCVSNTTWTPALHPSFTMVILKTYTLSLVAQLRSNEVSTMETLCHPFQPVYRQPTKFQMLPIQSLMATSALRSIVSLSQMWQVLRWPVRYEVGYNWVLHQKSLCHEMTLKCTTRWCSAAKAFQRQHYL